MKTPHNPPNILWLSFEDTNPFFGCYGDPVARTPHVDRLATEGCRWTHAFSTCGVCAPARSAVITGMYAISTGCHQMRTSHRSPETPELPTPYSAVLPPHVKCVPEYLRAAGYYCSNNSKTDYQFTPPMTAWDDCSTTGHWRNRERTDQPFFSVFNFTQSHESGMWAEKCPEPEFDPSEVQVPPYFPDTPKVRTAIARMHHNISRVDQLVGEKLRELEEDGLAGNTIVMVWSDHGPMPRGKRWPYDSGIRVPLIVRWPRNLDPGSVSSELVSTIDLGPTILSLAGVGVPRHMQGQIFLGPEKDEPREFVFASRDRHDIAYDRVRASRDRRYKYMRHYHPELERHEWGPYMNHHPITQEWIRGFRRKELNGIQASHFEPVPPEELYDTENDPWETNNLAANPGHATTLERHRQAVDEWTATVGDYGDIPESEMVRRWYPDGKQPQTGPANLIIYAEDHNGEEPSNEGGEFTGPAVFQLHCATQGASLTYTFDEGDDARWRLYTGFVRLPKGTTRIRTKAIRIGYQDSEERVASVTVA